MKDINTMTPEEFQRYGRNRVKMMLKMRNQAELWLQQKDTPMQRLILQTAEHHLCRAEELFGISRNDIRMRKLCG